ncbi:MAG TPA: tetratricopeptide repeat protein [Methylomirabilota bacterium]|nr:tetratricopeptide repeat protein [Methylomirabilota bacterium]
MTKAQIVVSKRVLIQLLVAAALHLPDLHGQTSTPESIRNAINQERFAEASGLLKSGLTSAPGNRDLLLLRTDLAARQSQWKEALQEIGALRAQEPNNAELRLKQAQILAWSGRLRESEAAYTELIEANPRDGDSLLGRGLTRFWRSDWEGALADFNKAIDIDASNDLAFTSMLKALIAQGRPTEAWQLGASASQLSAEGNLALASIAAQGGAFNEAERRATVAAEDPDTQRQQIVLRAQQKLRLGEADAAVQLVREFSSKRTNDYLAQVDLGNVLAAADRRREARVAYEHAQTLRPQRTEARKGLARLQSREGRLNGSLKSHQALMAENPEDAEASLGAFRVAMLLGNRQAAREALQKAEKAAPRSSDVADARALLALVSGSRAEFQSVVERFKEMQPHDWRAQYWSALVRQMNGQNPAEPLELDVLNAVGSAALLSIPREGGLFAARTGLGALPPELQGPAASALARELALQLHPQGVEELAEFMSQEEAQRVRALQQGWSAYLAEPLVRSPHFPMDRREQLLWQLRETERRLRTFYVEADSGVYHRWLARRMAWLNNEEGEYQSEEALERAVEEMMALIGLPSAWTVAEWREAIRESEEVLGAKTARYEDRLQVARWQQSRFDWNRASEALERLREDFPKAVEPHERLASIRKAQGRWESAERVYLHLQDDGLLTPTTELEHIDLHLIQREDELAERRLVELKEQGFSEPEWHVAWSRLAQSRWRWEEALERVEQGLAEYPDSPLLRSEQAELLRELGREEQLADALSVEATPEWIRHDLVRGADDQLKEKPEGSTNAFARITNSAPWIYSWAHVSDNGFSHAQARSIGLGPDEFGLSAGHELGVIEDTDNLGANRPDWHDAWMAAYWRRNQWQTFALDYHHYERFGGNADQLNLSIAQGWTHDWFVRANAGFALNGDFIPEWRAGAGATYRWHRRFLNHLDVNYLEFKDVNVWQFVPALTWWWSPEFSSDARLYISRNELQTGTHDVGLTGYVDLSWWWEPRSYVRAFYSGGDQNSANLVRDLIGEEEFHSVGIESRWQFADLWAVQPSYRFERHQSFNIHALGVSLHFRY